MFPSVALRTVTGVLRTQKLRSPYSLNTEQSKVLSFKPEVDQNTAMQKSETRMTASVLKQDPST